MHQILVPVRSGVKLKPAASSLTNNSMGFATFVEGKWKNDWLFFFF